MYAARRDGAASEPSPARDAHQGQSAHLPKARLRRRHAKVTHHNHLHKDSKNSPKVATAVPQLWPCFVLDFAATCLRLLPEDTASCVRYHTSMRFSLLRTRHHEHGGARTLWEMNGQGLSLMEHLPSRTWPAARFVDPWPPPPWVLCPMWVSNLPVLRKTLPSQKTQ
jgi:hypothetical protein